jgi:hypothetical protein
MSSATVILVHPKSKRVITAIDKMLAIGRFESKDNPCKVTFILKSIQVNPYPVVKQPDKHTEVRCSVKVEVQELADTNT